MRNVILTTGSAKHFKIPSGKIKIGRFSGGEVLLSVKEDVQNLDVCIIGSTNAPAENIIELVFAIDTVRRLGAKSIAVLIPYFAYSRSVKEKFPGETVSASVLAKMLTAAGGEKFKVITVDIHSPLLSKFFNIPVQNIDPSGLFSKNLKEFDPELTVVAPDAGAKTRAANLAQKININKIAVIHKVRHEDGSVEIKDIAGKISKKALIVDDIVDTGGTILKGAEFLKMRGVKEVYVSATHMVWQGGGYKKLADSDLIKKIYTTNSIAPPAKIPGKIEIIDISQILLDVAFLN